MQWEGPQKKSDNSSVYYVCIKIKFDKYSLPLGLNFILAYLSLFEEHHHWIANVQTDVAAVVVSDAVAAFFNHKTVPVPLVLPIKLFLDFTSDIREMRWFI